MKTLNINKCVKCTEKSTEDRTTQKASLKQPQVKSTDRHVNYCIIIIIIYHDFLPTPRRGSHVKSDKTHTQS